jgi:hypothetical protein
MTYKRVISSIIFFISAVASAQQSPMRHPELSIESVHVEPIRREDLFSSVKPISHESLSFDTVSDIQKPEPPRHIDFGGGTQNIRSTEIQSNELRNNFSNIRMEFESPDFQHLNFNVQ